MKVLALDISTKTGWALLEGGPGLVPTLLDRGTLTLSRKVQGYGGHPYPVSHLLATSDMASDIAGLWVQHRPDTIVIEETNGSKNRYTQKILEWIHFAVCFHWHRDSRHTPLHYINTSDWRKVVGAVLTKEDKKLNAKVRKLKKAGDKAGLKVLGVRGKVGKKHVAVRYVNQTFALNLKMKDNDQADAICLGTAYFLGVPRCDGT